MVVDGTLDATGENGGESPPSCLVMFAVECLCSFLGWVCFFGGFEGVEGRS